MRIYELHFFDGDGRRPLLDFHDGVDDADALRAAGALLAQHASCEGVEIHDGDRIVGRLLRSEVATL